MLYIVLRLITISSLMVLRLGAQGIVQVSSLTADPPALNCGGHEVATTVTAQVYFAGIDMSDIKSGVVTLGLGIYSSNPPTNQLRILKSTKQIELQVSPGVAEFQVSCAANTQNGAVSLVASILKVPDGVKIDADPLFIATIKIVGAASASPMPKSGSAPPRGDGRAQK